MIDVDKIEDIRKRARRGQPVAVIARELHVSEPTVRKYRDMEDLSQRPGPEREPQFPSLDGLTDKIDAWLEDDVRQWRKQRHTAVRVYVRLRDEEGYQGSYSTVQRYVRRRREQMARERDAAGFLLLEWLPGECQVDFGEADFRVRGVTVRGKYLTVSFPHANVGLTQVFWGETSECVCQGLRNVFEFLGGVPVRAVFDNATEVGRRVGSAIHTSEMFRLFAAHYGLDYTFTNPYSGNEKGNVENMVGTHRRNLFVPVPSFSDVRGFNARLLRDSMDLSDKRLRQAPLPPGHPAARAVRGGQGGALPAARRRVLVRQVGEEGAPLQQAGRRDGRRRPPLQRRPGHGRQGGPRRARRLRRDGPGRRHRRGRRDVRARVGRGAHQQRRPDPAAEAAVHALCYVNSS